MAAAHSSWADEVEEEEREEGPLAPRSESRDGWHEGLQVGGWRRAAAAAAAGLPALLQVGAWLCGPSHRRPVLPPRR